MKDLDDGPDGLNDAAFDRALRGNTDATCAKGDATHASGVWTCSGCGRTFKRSLNHHIYAARKRLRRAKENGNG